MCLIKHCIAQAQKTDPIIANLGISTAAIRNFDDGYKDPGLGKSARCDLTLNFDYVSQFDALTDDGSVVQ